MSDVQTSFGHDTHWKLEKREGGVDEFVIDRMSEAKAVVAGNKPWNVFTGKARDALMDWNDQLTIWRGTLPRDEFLAWTPDRIIDESVRKLFYQNVPAYEVVERDGNILVTAGITALLSLLTGGGATNFGNTNAYLGVGDSTTAAAVGQTDLQAATNKVRKAMNATYPVSSAPTIDFQATFGSSDANFSWNELGTFNASSSGTMLNRVVQSLGTKASGSTWSLTETITWS